MKINEQKTCFIEVKFGDLKPGDAFAEQVLNPDDEDDYVFVYMMKGWSSSNPTLDDLFKAFHEDEERVDIHRGWAINLRNGVIRYYDPDWTVIPIKINADVSWPTKCIRRK